MTCGYRNVHLEIHSTIEALDLVQAVTEHIGRRLGFDDESLHWTAMAVRESVVNAIKHGNESDPAQFIVSVRDQGRGFDPDTVKDPLAEENMLRTSGRGVFMIRHFMDEVSMRRLPQGGMEMRMIKHIRPPA